MKLVARFELASRSTRELHALIRDLLHELANSGPDRIRARGLYLRQALSHWNFYSK